MKLKMPYIFYVAAAFAMLFTSARAQTSLRTVPDQTCARWVFTSVRTYNSCAGTGDPVVDTAAINQAISSNNVVYFPPGIYYYTGLMTLPGNKSFRLYGDGPGISTIIFTGATSGINAPNMHKNSLEIEGLTVMAKPDNGASGTAIYAVFDSGNTKFRTTTIRNVEIAGSDRSAIPTGWWTNGIYLEFAQNAIIEDVQVHGRFEYSSGVPTSNVGIHWGSSPGLPTTQLFLHDIYVNNFKRGIETSGWIEGLYMSGFEIVYCGGDTTPPIPAIDLTSSGPTPPGFNILYGNVDFWGDGIRMTNLSTIKIAHVNTFHRSNGGGTGTHVFLGGCVDATIADNSFISYSLLFAQENGVFANNSTIVRISGNIFRGLHHQLGGAGSCVVVDAGSSNVTVLDNMFNDVSSRYDNLGSNTIVRDLLP